MKRYMPLIVLLALLALGMCLSPSWGAAVVTDMDAGSVWGGCPHGYCYKDIQCGEDPCPNLQEGAACYICTNYTDSTKMCESDYVHVLRQCHLKSADGDCGEVSQGECTNKVCNGTMPPPGGGRCTRTILDPAKQNDGC